jgi:uncharacterized phage protein gp47/JayE
MPWSTPTLYDVRVLVRDSIQAMLPGADAMVPNSVLRVLSDSQGAQCHAVLQYVDWLARQLLPDTAETEWLDRHGKIWLKNADGSTGRKAATLASGTATFTGVFSTIIPIGQQLVAGEIGYETTAQIEIDVDPTPCPVRALDPGTIGNLDPGTVLNLTDAPIGADAGATVVTMSGGTDEETDEELRVRVLMRIQQPPMGGDANDYVAWALAVPGVTRAWAISEMGAGTVTVRFMMDDLRASNGGFPTDDDITMVTGYIDTVRPVTVKDRWVLAPIPEYINFTIKGLLPDTDPYRVSIEDAVRTMLRNKAAPAQTINGVPIPAQTIYAAWVSEAIMSVSGVIGFTLLMDDHPMPYNGSLAVLGTILYER